MSEIKWIKLQTDIFDNRKIKQLERLPDGDTLIVIWLKILVLAGSVNDGGLVYFTQDIPYTDQLLATEFNRPLSTVQFALRTFQQFGMIEIVNDLIHVSNWERYQNIEGLEKVREQNRLRKQNQRERERLLMSRDCHVTVTESHATEKELDKEIEKESDKKSKRFAAPTVEEVRVYCQERGNSVDAQRFVDYYGANGWKVGKNPMKDWKAAVRTWENNGYDAPKKNPKYASTGQQKPLDADTWDKIMERI